MNDVDINGLRNNYLKKILKFKPEDMSSERFMERALLDLYQKEHFRNNHISPQLTTRKRVEKTFELICSYPYFRDSLLGVYITEEKRKLVITYPEEVEEKLGGEGILNYSLNEFGELRIKPSKKLNPYEEFLLGSLAETLALHIKNANDYEKNAFTDALTGLNNARFFDATLSKYLKTIEKLGEISLMFLDIDNLRETNNDHPLHHSAGDILLVGFSQLLKSILRDRDVICRPNTSGDEFRIIMPATTLENALKKADVIRQMTQEKFFFPLDNYPNLMQYMKGFESGIYPSIRSTVSIGIANTNHIPDLKDLINYAERSMYAAKAKKNCVECLL